MKNTSKFDELMLGDGAQLVALDEAEMGAIDGGNPVLWFVVGYVGSKVIDGVIDAIRHPCKH